MSEPKQTTLEYDSIAIDQDPSNIFLNRRWIGTPEENLWLAVIKQGLIDLGIRFHEDQRDILWDDWRDAKKWIFQKSKDGLETEFELICDYAKVDADIIREGVIRYKCECCNKNIHNRPCRRRVIKVIRVMVDASKKN